jgi:predicted TIM-barrel fold metal-dependent hydrolase
MSRNSLDRVVIVQPSIYGFDNSCMLDSLNALGGAGRGVAVVDQDASQEELLLLAAQGVRGLRVNLESAGVRNSRAIGFALAHWAERAASVDWHLQVYASLETIVAAAPNIGKLAVPIVLDHFAMVQDLTPPGDSRLEAILELLRSGRAYVKLSAPYRLHSSESEDFEAVAKLAAAYLHANPDMVLWGSDWPHTNRETGKKALEVSAYRQLGRDYLAQGIERWLPTSKLQLQVLVENPARLYGFLDGTQHYAS